MGGSCEGGGSTSLAQELSVVYREANNDFGANAQIQPATAEFATLHARYGSIISAYTPGWIVVAAETNHIFRCNTNTNPVNHK